METTTVKIPNNLLPLWRGIEGLDDEGRKAILVIVNGYYSNRIKEHSPELKKNHSDYSDPSQQFYIAPEVKALQTGFKPSKDLSVDYKKELGEALEAKYL